MDLHALNATSSLSTVVGSATVVCQPSPSVTDVIDLKEADSLLQLCSAWLSFQQKHNILNHDPSPFGH